MIKRNDFKSKLRISLKMVLEDTKKYLKKIYKKHKNFIIICLFAIAYFMILNYIILSIFLIIILPAILFVVFRSKGK